MAPTGPRSRQVSAPRVARNVHFSHMPGRIVSDTRAVNPAPCSAASSARTRSEIAPLRSP